MKRWGLIFAGLLALLELGLRFGVGLGQPPIVLLDDPDGIEYRLKPDAQYLRWGNNIVINRHGLRGADFPLVPAEDGARVLLVGDSVVYGNHFLDQSEIMGSRLSAICDGWEVVNVAASSWGPVNQDAFLERYGLFGAESAVIVISSHDLVDVPAARREVIPYRTSAPVGAVGDALEALWERFERRFLPAKEVAGDRSVRKERSLAALERMMARMMMVDMNRHLYLHPLVDDDPEEVEAFEAFAALAGRYGFTIYQMRAALDAEDYRDRIHPTASGADVYARHIAQRLGC